MTLDATLRGSLTIHVSLNSLSLRIETKTKVQQEIDFDEGNED